VHDRPTGRQLRRARTYRTHHIEQSYRHVAVAYITPTAGHITAVCAAPGKASARTVTPRALFRPVASVKPLIAFLTASICWRAIPSGGTAFKIFTHLAGAPALIGTGRPLSTGDLVHGRRMNMNHALTTLRGAQ
jgi:hypothetical protein